VNKLAHAKKASAAESKYRFSPYRNPYSHPNGIAILFNGIRTVERSAMETGRTDLRFRLHLPTGVKDWNDALRTVPKYSFPTVLFPAS